MKTLFVEKQFMELRYERACLLLYHEGKRLSSVPLAQLERIVVAPHVALSAGVLGLIAEKEIALLVLNSRYPERTAVLSGTIKGDVHRRMCQYQLLLDESFRLHWSCYLVRLKIMRQCRLLTSVKKNRPDLRLALTKAINSLNQLLTNFHDEKTISTLANLRGEEGAAAAVYFKAYSHLFAPALLFTMRNRRPPKDPVNVCLSLAYTLFYQEAINALKAVGLDSALGCYHELYYNRDSLACDLLEPVRPLIDAWVYHLFQQHILRLEDFSMGEICLLHTAGKQRFYEAYRLSVPRFRRLLRRYSRFSANIVCQYEPISG